MKGQPPPGDNLNPTRGDEPPDEVNAMRDKTSRPLTRPSKHAIAMLLFYLLASVTGGCELDGYEGASPLERACGQDPIYENDTMEVMLTEFSENEIGYTVHLVRGGGCETVDSAQIIYDVPNKTSTVLDSAPFERAPAHSSSAEASTHEGMLRWSRNHNIHTSRSTTAEDRVELIIIDERDEVAERAVYSCEVSPGHTLSCAVRP